MNIACPQCGHEYDRTPETSRREKAVEALLAEGWKWKDGKWWAPRFDRPERVQREADAHDAALWRLLVAHSDVDMGTGHHDGVTVHLHNPEGHELRDFGPNLEDIIGELARHLLETNEGIAL